MGNKIFCTIIALTFFVLLFFDLSLHVLAVLNILFFIFSFVSLARVQNNSFTPFSIILVSLFLFHCGHLWLNLLDTDVEKWEFLFDYSASLALQKKVYSYVTQLLICFYLVGLIKLRPVLDLQKDYFIFTSTSKFFNFIFFLAYFVSLYFDIMRAIKVAAVGYGLGYTYEFGFAFTLSAFLNGLFIFMFLVNRNNKKFLYLLISLVLLRIFIVMFLVGNRGGSIVFAILIVYILSKFTILKNFFSNKSVIFLMVISMTIFLPLISLTRTDTIHVDSISDFIFKYNPISYFFAEFGSTIKTVILAFQYDIPKFGNGTQFFYSTLPIVPGSDALFGSVYREYVSIGGELNKLASIQGLGGSLLANVYVNFGNAILGFIAICFFARLTCLFSNRLNNTNQSIYKLLLYSSMFAGMLTAVRGEWYDFVTQVKTMLYLILILWMFSKFGVKLYK